MKRVASFLIVAAILLNGRVAAQSRPDFSGTWKGSSGVLTIKQTATALTVAQGSDTRTYNLDGSESRFEKSATSQLTARARWVQSALVIETKTVSNIGTWTDLEVYSFDHSPQGTDPQLSVVLVFTREAGPMMGTTVTTYRK